MCFKRLSSQSIICLTFELNTAGKMMHLNCDIVQFVSDANNGDRSEPSSALCLRKETFSRSPIWTLNLSRLLGERRFARTIFRYRADPSPSSSADTYIISTSTRLSFQTDNKLKRTKRLFVSILGKLRSLRKRASDRRREGSANGSKRAGKCG